MRRSATLDVGPRTSIERVSVRGAREHRLPLCGCVFSNATSPARRRQGETRPGLCVTWLGCRWAAGRRCCCVAAVCRRRRVMAALVCLPPSSFLARVQGAAAVGRPVPSPVVPFRRRFPLAPNQLRRAAAVAFYGGSSVGRLVCRPSGRLFGSRLRLPRSVPLATRRHFPPSLPPRFRLPALGGVPMWPVS